jgi:hypothetical protein
LAPYWGDRLAFTILIAGFLILALMNLCDWIIALLGK